MNSILSARFSDPDPVFYKVRIQPTVRPKTFKIKSVSKKTMIARKNWWCKGSSFFLWRVGSGSSYLKCQTRIRLDTVHFDWCSTLCRIDVVPRGTRRILHFTLPAGKRDFPARDLRDLSFYPSHSSYPICDCSRSNHMP